MILLNTGYDKELDIKIRKLANSSSHRIFNVSTSYDIMHAELLES
jgi:hypothetical protein